LQQYLSVGKIVDLDQLGKFKISIKGVVQSDTIKLSTKHIQKY
jgi:hypothetical protein